MKKLHNIKKDTTMEDMGNFFLRIYASLENQWEEHQYNMIEVEGYVKNQPMTILID